MPSYILTKSICTNQEMILIITNQAILNLFLLKLFCQKNLILLLAAFIKIHLWIYAPSMIITYSSFRKNFERKWPKKKFLTGDFNVDMLKLDSYKQIHKWFILKLFAGSNSFTSKTIIDNMFSNIAESFIKNVATGNTGLGMTCRC